MHRDSDRSSEPDGDGRGKRVGVVDELQRCGHGGQDVVCDGDVGGDGVRDIVADSELGRDRCGDVVTDLEEGLRTDRYWLNRRQLPAAAWKRSARRTGSRLLKIVVGSPTALYVVESRR